MDGRRLNLDKLDRFLLRFPQAQKPLAFSSTARAPSGGQYRRDGRGKVCVKRHHCSVRDKDSLLDEHRWLAYLSARTAIVKKPLADLAAETVVTLGEWTYEVHPVGDGLDLIRKRYRGRHF